MLALAGVSVCGCVGDGDDSAPDEALRRHRTEVPPALPPQKATRPPSRARVLPPSGHRPPGSKRVTAFIGDRTSHLRPTVVAFLPRGWRMDKSPRDPAAPRIFDTPPRLASGDDAALAFYGSGHTVLVADCRETSPSAGRERPSGLDDPTGEVAARAKASTFYLPRPGRLQAPKPPPRLAPRVYRAQTVVTVGFPGGGCLLLGDPAFGTLRAGHDPKVEQRRIREARRRPLPRHLVGIAKRTTGHWGTRLSVPPSNRRAEAIARLAQRAVVSAPRFRYEERLAFCTGGPTCRSTRLREIRAGERDRAPAYAFAKLSGPTRDQPLRIVKSGREAWYADVASCWTREPFRGALSTSADLFLVTGPWSADQRAAFFPPLYRLQLSSEPPRPSGRGRTRLYWSSYADRGTALVENATLRLLRVDRIRASRLNVERQRISFAYPSRLEHERPEPECQG
jgi:hypothetical protein